jgi:hypothetical protein
MKTAMPFAIELRKTEPRSDSAATIRTPPASSSPGVTIWSGHHFPSACVSSIVVKYSASTYGTHTAAAPRKRATSTVARPTGRTTSGCNRPRSGVAADDAEREEDREHDAEEERSEHRHSEQEGGRERMGIDPGGRDDVVDVVERVAVAEPVEGDEGDRQHADDDEHLAPQGFAQAIASDRQRRRHSVSPPTAST